MRPSDATRIASQQGDGCPWSLVDHRVLPEVNCPEPGGSVAEIACGTKSDSFGNSEKREIGERVSNSSNIPSQTEQALVEKIVVSRIGTTIEDRLDNRFGPRTKAGSVSRSYAQEKQSMLRAWRETSGIITPALPGADQFP